MTAKNLGQIIREHRKKAGLTQIGLARMAGVGKTAVYDIEHDKETIRLDTLHKVLRILNIRLCCESPLMEKIFL